MNQAAAAEMMKNMSPEQLAAVQQQMANMSPEQMEQMTRMASTMMGGSMPQLSPEEMKKNMAEASKMSPEQFRAKAAESQTMLKNQQNYRMNFANSEKAKGNASFRKGQYEQAIPCYKAAIEAVASDKTHESTKMQVACLNNTAKCHFQLKRFEEVISTTSQALTLDPVNIKAFFNRGLAQEACGRKSKAARDLRTAIKNSAPDAADMEVGDEVKAVGLVGAAHLNGCQGIVVQRLDPQTGRVTVQFDGEQNKAIKPKNIESAHKGMIPAIKEALERVDDGSAPSIDDIDDGDSLDTSFTTPSPSSPIAPTISSQMPMPGSMAPTPATAGNPMAGMNVPNLEGMTNPMTGKPMPKITPEMAKGMQEMFTKMKPEDMSKMMDLSNKMMKGEMNGDTISAATEMLGKMDPKMLSGLAESLPESKDKDMMKKMSKGLEGMDEKSMGRLLWFLQLCGRFVAMLMRLRKFAMTTQGKALMVVLLALIVYRMIAWWSGAPVADLVETTVDVPGELGGVQVEESEWDDA